MQNISPRQYFETRIRKLPIYKCYVNADWEEGKIASVMVLRSHVNGNVSGSNFLVDLLCLGVKDVSWFFNTDPDEMTQLSENGGLPLVEVSYELAHNIVYAGLEFAAAYQIKPHSEFAIAKYALEEDDDAIALIEIETGEDGVPHLIEKYPGQYADAHNKLKKHAGLGNFKISIAIFNEDDEDDLESENDTNEEDWEDENWDDEEEEEISLKDIPIGDLTVFDAMMLPGEELVNTKQIAKRNELEQMKIALERLVRMYELLEQQQGFKSSTLGMDESVMDEIANIKELSEENLVDNLLYPNGCDEENFNQGLAVFFNLFEKMLNCTIDEKKFDLNHLLQTTSKENPLVLTHCIFYLLVDGEGSALFTTIQPFINAMENYPMVALAQTFLVTADPEKFPQPPLLIGNSHVLQNIFNDYLQFSDEEFALFYALRCLQAAKQKNVPLMTTWYRLMATTEAADIYLGMLMALYKYMTEGAEEFLEQLGEKG